MSNIGIAPPPPPKLSINKVENSSKKEKLVEKEKPVKKELLSEFPKVEQKNNQPKKDGLFKRMFSKTEEEPHPLKDEEGEFDLEKLREQFKIPEEKEVKKTPVQKNKKTKESKLETLDWTGGDIVDEMHNPKEDGHRWDAEDLDHIGMPIPPLPIKKQVKKTAKKVAVKKPVSKKVPKTIISRKSKVDKVIDEYFKTVEKEQKMIQKELDMIVVHPKKALKKGTKNYMIHHHEKLIKSMKELLAAINSIEDEQFKRSVQANKKSFYNWVKGILEKEKKAEIQRNKILKQNIKEVLKEYSDGLNKDIFDKKYELDAEKKASDRKLKEITQSQAKLNRLDVRLKEQDVSLKQKEKDVNLLIEEGIKNILDKRLKKEHTNLKRAETIAHNKTKEYDAKAEELAIKQTNFNKRRLGAKKMIDEGDKLRRLKTTLENKDERLKKLSEELTVRETAAVAKEKELVLREKAAKAILKREEELVVGEKELELEKKDFSIEKKSFELRRKEVHETEGYLETERHDLKEIKENLTYREHEAKEKLEEVKEIQNEIELEEEKLQSDRKEFEKKGFGKYLPEKEPPVFDEKVQEFYNLIQKTKDMLSNNQFDDAKQFYKEIRDRFNRTTFNDPNQKADLFNSIRELYDDIYLAVLSL